MICIAKSFSSKPRQASMAAYRQLLAKNHVEEILQDVKQNKNLDRKKELPVWLPLAECFTGGTRKAEDAQPSGLFFLDIDEKGLTEQLWKKVQEENLIEAFRIVYFAESAGGGTHIWAWRTPGKSIEEDIQKLASRLGVSYDSHVTDLARCCFMVSEQYVKLLDPVVFEPLKEEQKKMYATEVVTNSTEQVESNLSPLTSCPSPLNYKGIPYENIVQALLWKLGYGNAPVEGERNTALYTMSRYLRFICDFDEQKLFAILPHWGLSDHEVLSTIKSAVNSVRPAGIPSQMNEVLSTLGAAIETGTETTDDSLVTPVEAELPGILQDLSDHAPEEFREATLMAAMPMLGTLATGIRAKYRDGKLNSPSFIVDIEAPQATGKSFVDAEFELLMDPIIKQDEVDLPLLNKAIEEWDEGKRQEYLQTLRYSLDVLRRRAALNGFRAGIIAYLLEDRQETERAIKFAVWYAERCLHYQLQIYGDKIDALHDGTLSTQASKGNIRYLDALPKEFTKEDLVNLRMANNESPVVKTIICRWVKEILIKKIDTNLWQKIQP